MRNTALSALASNQVFSGIAANGLLANSRSHADPTLTLDSNWRFAGKQNADALRPEFDDSGLPQITLPHGASELSWQNWKPESWQDVWYYRRHFDLPAGHTGERWLLRFERVMAGATPYLNGHSLPQHLGGFLPFEYDVTDFVREGENLLAVAVDGRWLNAPPSGSPSGPGSIDYLLPGGITGSVSLHAVQPVYIDEVFAKPVDVLKPDRKLEITCRVNARNNFPARIRVTTRLRSGAKTVAETSELISLHSPSDEVHLTLGGLEQIALWDTENPSLYDLEVTLAAPGQSSYSYATRIGFRQAIFTQQGFFLNDRRLQLFGLNRHELYPYLGFAVPRRLLRKDAEILRRDFNCNVVRCSHYPQSEAFLDARDELGLLVWEEIPGWQYLGDESWQALALRDVEAMIRRDRNRPSIIVWGVRVNESENDPSLYQRTTALAKQLDDTRPASGTMTPSSRKNWQAKWREDVFAFDDYHSAADGTVGILDPTPGFPYLIAETVGQFNYTSGKEFDRKYRRAAAPELQTQQALFHAQAHDRAAADRRIAGVIAWCAFDYASLVNSYDGVKYPGVADVFRFLKPAASFYLAQTDRNSRPVIEPAFYWDFGSSSPNGPDERAPIFSNCDELRISIDGQQQIVVSPIAPAIPISNIRHSSRTSESTASQDRNCASKALSPENLSSRESSLPIRPKTRSGCTRTMRNSRLTASIARASCLPSPINLEIRGFMKMDKYDSRSTAPAKSLATTHSTSDRAAVLARRGYAP